LMEVRRAIEVQTARLAAARCTPEELAVLQEIVGQMAAHLEDLDEYIELDTSLHLRLAGASHNTMLYHLVESLGDPARRSVREGLLHRHSLAELERVQALHEELIVAVARGDVEGAGQAMASHFDDAVTALVSGEG
jgi:GntR family transcriptional regulator, transcriptional repressor for pyruvate dehydrogenase complex